MLCLWEYTTYKICKRLLIPVRFGRQIIGSIFSYKLRYIVGFELVEKAISINSKTTIYRNLYKNNDPGERVWFNES